jgi:hypothetical protein
MGTCAECGRDLLVVDVQKDTYQWKYRTVSPSRRHPDIFRPVLRLLACCPDDGILILVRKSQVTSSLSP